MRQDFAEGEYEKIWTSSMEEHLVERYGPGEFSGEALRWISGDTKIWLVKGEEDYRPPPVLAYQQISMASKVREAEARAEKAARERESKRF